MVIRVEMRYHLREFHSSGYKRFDHSVTGVNEENQFHSIRSRELRPMRFTLVVYGPVKYLSKCNVSLRLRMKAKLIRERKYGKRSSDALCLTHENATQWTPKNTSYEFKVNGKSQWLSAIDDLVLAQP